ncbi:MAG: hypothetical protein HN657_04185 [Candidatus Marinimicrobia bacterium]|nr:hypothetical protein [Candidatus Neomarinimicrobiota bacterium]MBT3497194.1 hypothetical protein [Candidatus Neomarinimicrobiota bacterium]MBT4144408.1 hypothetical protein [Candidatus Neomarinimicrobiota bacterium]MBT4178284.1 hypothetical protein [Candidatus Neomarinimicrobiota bacterium]MBT4592771.1 hypothetical protein [Candidatus Neomarinimicrobiota bacterium]
MKTLFITSLCLILNVSHLMGGDVSGKISFDGKAPKMKALKIAADPVCVANNTSAPTKEWLIVDANGGVKNVLVYISEGVSASKEAPTNHVVIDQKGCVYTPHVIGVQVGQPLDILNNDGTLHNIHALPKLNREFNKAMPKFKKKMTTQFDKAEDPFKIKCDVHPWMGAYIGVFDHPYFVVSGNDGSYTISGLNPGTYTITAWHEKLKTKTITVKVGDGSTTADFTFSKPQKKK